MIVILSIGTVAMVIENAMTIRAQVLMPPGLGEQVRDLLSAGQLAPAHELCRQEPSFLAYVLQAGIAEYDGGWSAVEKAMEDASAEQSARLFRKVEYLSVIGNIAPMLGLLGTVIGMILAFREVADTQGAARAADLAEGIYLALVTTVEGLIVAIPAGLGTAIYLSEYASPRTRGTLKPVLEVLAGIPTVVYGYFALTAVTPLLRDIGIQVDIFNALSGGLVVGVMLIPTVASLSEDAMASVPQALRDGAYGLGADRLQVSLRVVVPAAISGIIASFVLAISRRWPEPEAAYRRWHRERAKNDFGLGAVQFVQVAERVWVANLVGQRGIRTGSKGAPVRYDAIGTGLAAVAGKAAELGASVHMPRIGCGLAGGRWERVAPLIEEQLGRYGIAVTVYDHEG